MEVVAAPPPSTGSSPFRDHDIREWSRIDSITGALERARLETDSWAATTKDATHRYGKVVDSRARTGADGSLQAQASRQLEVFQSRAAGAHLQVVKTTTVSSSRWSGKLEESSVKGPGFGDLQLPLHPLDLTSEKSKASVGRSANRRPPSRHPRTTIPSTTFSNDLHNQLRHAHFTAATNLHRVSRLCHQIHESAVRNVFGRKSPSLSPRGSADGSVSGVEIVEIESSATSNSDSHSNLTRTKSNSSEDVQQIPEKETGGLAEVESWRRNSKIRRSLPFSKASSPSVKVKKTVDIPESSVSVKKLRDELEKGRRLTTALRNNSLSGDLNAIDSIIQSISSASSLERSSVDDSLDDTLENELVTSKNKQKRESFVTVESLQEIKGRLRRTSSPGSSQTVSNGIGQKQDDSDDGIVTSEDSKVKSYVYGMEKMLPSKKSVIGTGSLESRSKFSNGSGNNKSEDWYNRRKSYGFEKVQGPDDASSKPLKNKSFVESSTDSGICRSSEIMVVPTATKSNLNNDQTNGQSNSGGSSESDVEIKFGPNADKSLNGIHYGNVKKMTSIFNQEDKNPFICRSSDLAWRKKNELKSTTITIPIVKNNNVVDLPWNNEAEKDSLKRQPIAVDENYNASNGSDNQFRKSSLGNDLAADDGNRRAKKVEFCKTEVHFAAESGKVNIVETDEKPPPTQNFRRRRRNSGPTADYPPDFNKNGLPILHFGDSFYEKNMYGVADNQEQAPSAFSVVTVNNTEDANQPEYSEEERKDFNNLVSEIENLKGILKNKPAKPKPYHLGEPLPLADSDDDSAKWGVKLRHVPKEHRQPPIWKSTVTVRNTYQQEDQTVPDSNLPEFQKLLKILRPTTKKPDYLSDNENRYSDSFANIRVVPAAKDNRRSSWSVADRVKLDEEIQGSRGYLTKVNFGDGQATVVQNDQLTWPRVENLSKDSKQILNRGLVVRIGKQDSASKHTVCSKMTTTRKQNNTTTTTKITIDLSPSPPTTDNKRFLYTKYNKRSQNSHHSFKSTPLVLNTIKDQNEAVSRVPQQLEALRKLYEDIPTDEGDSDADKEVRELLSGVSRQSPTDSDEGSSVISGSWSRMRAFKNITEAERSSFKETKLKFDLNSSVKDNKGDIPQETTAAPVEPHQPKTSYNKYSIHSTNGGSKYSPVVLRKTIPLKPTTEPQPELIGFQATPSGVAYNSNDKCSISSDALNKSPLFREFKNSPDSNLRAKCVTERAVLRQPKQSEMTYFGVNTIKTSTEEVARKVPKPDLLQNHKRSVSPSRTVGKPRKPTPEADNKKSEEHIYENVKVVNDKELNATKCVRKDFDAAILDELTKAADQILQAVNGYTSEDCQNRLSGDEEDLRKPLDTISETKSWKNSSQDLEIRNQQRMRPTLASAAKMKVKRTSSTSSVESLSRDRRKTLNSDSGRTIASAPTVKQASQETSKKKIVNDQSSARSSTKARRLQRASSREALLQSHGSSSEDLPANIEVPVRKPRLIKKTKTSQLTLTSGIELKKPVRKSREEKEKVKDRTNASKNDSKILGSLPEIRHKTAISTITSTAEKCSRDRSKTRNDDSKSKSHTKKESSNKGTVSSSSTVRQASASSKGSQSQRPLTSAAREPSGVTQHRISTANIKRCHRSESATRH